jgi:hypothetical protein
VVLPLDTAARRLLRLGLVQVADSPMPDAESAAVLEKAHKAAATSKGTNGTAASSSSGSRSSTEVEFSARDTSDASSSWVLLQASSTALSAVPLDEAVKILGQQWQERLQVSPTGSLDAAASYTQLKQRLCDTATPELWEWVEQEALVALADMGVTSSLSPAGRRSKRGGSPNGNSTSTQSADSSRTVSPAALPGEGLLAAPTTTFSSNSSSSSGSSSGSSRADRSWVARAGCGAPHPHHPRARRPIPAPRRVPTAPWGKRLAVARPALRLVC